MFVLQSYNYFFSLQTIFVVCLSKKNNSLIFCVMLNKKNTNANQCIGGF